MEAPSTSQNSFEKDDTCDRCGKCRCGGRRHSEATPEGTTGANDEQLPAGSVPHAPPQAAQ